MATIPFETRISRSLKLTPGEELDVPPRPANLMTAGMQLLSETMGEIVTKQMEFMRNEGGEIAKSAAAVGQPGNLIEAAERYVMAIRSSTEAGLTNLRDIQNLIGGCAWGLVRIYIDTVSEAAGNGRSYAFTRKA